MVNLLSPSTPPPSTIHTPDTPQYGFYDNYQPYSPRRSNRLAQRHQHLQKVALSSQSFSDNFHSNRNSSNTAKAVPFKIATNHLCSQAVSKLHYPIDICSERNGKEIFTQPSDSASEKAVQYLEISARANVTDNDQRSSSTIRKIGMLPTPSKTPKKKPQKTSKSVTSIARNLFPVQAEAAFGSSLISDKKANSKDKLIQDKTSTTGKSRTMKIFTDSHDRIPEIDSCPNNPFYTNFKSAQHDATKRTCKRRRVMIPGEGLKSVEDIQGRKDGLLYVLQVWKKFSENVEADMDAPEDSLRNRLLIDEFLEPSLDQILTRSPMKPRLLFPQTRKRQFQELDSHSTENEEEEEEEEAETDIEENVALASTAPVEKLLTTPKSSITTPVSPPTTLRVTRSKRRDLNDLPGTPTADRASRERSSKFRKIQEPEAGSRSNFSQHFKLRAGETPRQMLW
ncbi:hypothetical protein GcC1_015009 [Golovinomyces cichoracearum]|uniref:Uncharacterized protein n=1 Tax=Golovinomyces cichoracearum TaxID=62708 RepID=A0A420J6D8_9PEZI|nr:hypothetical protein GcC1_015009 [Golovinomyces cichoracearum]